MASWQDKNTAANVDVFPTDPVYNHADVTHQPIDTMITRITLRGTQIALRFFARLLQLWQTRQLSGGLPSVAGHFTITRTSEPTDAQGGPYRGRIR